MSSYLFRWSWSHHPRSLQRPSHRVHLDFRQVKNELSASIYAISSDTLLTFQDHFEHHFIRYGIYHVVNMFFRLVPFFFAISLPPIHESVVVHFVLGHKLLPVAFHFHHPDVLNAFDSLVKRSRIIIEAI